MIAKIVTKWLCPAATIAEGEHEGPYIRDVERANEGDTYEVKLRQTAQRRKTIMGYLSILAWGLLPVGRLAG